MNSIHATDGTNIMRHTYERFENNKWIETELSVSTILDGLIWRSILEKNNEKEERWYIGGKEHRLDKPSHIVETLDGKITQARWAVYGIILEDFTSYFYLKIPIRERLFKYITDHPIYIEEIELLARHNNWLNEKELLLLSTIDMLK